MCLLTPESSKKTVCKNMASKKDNRTFHIAVVGMSGPTKVRGDLGVGKSCLCNRFLRPAEDDFRTNHASTLSHSDFGGRVINNDQFLYWGEVIKDHEGVDMRFRVIEQTEFTDDVSFSVFKGSTSKDYFKRCAETKINSPEKVAYICKDQLGDEDGFPQQILPKDFHIDGYLLLFDVSNVTGRTVSAQRDFIDKLYSAIAKTHRPTVLVASKLDAVCDVNLIELKRFSRLRKLTMVECSANLGVNVTVPFFKLASMINKKLPNVSPMIYNEALRKRSQRLDMASKKFDEALRATILNKNVLWQDMKEKLECNADSREYITLAGSFAAKEKFRRLMTRLNAQYENDNLKIEPYYFLPKLSGDDVSRREELSKARYCDRSSCAGVSSHALCTMERSETLPRQSTLRKKLPCKPRQLPRQPADPGKYCNIEDTLPRRSSRLMRDISRMHSMETNGLCNRWMGTMNRPDGSKKCVVLTAIKVKNDLQWDQFVKRSLDLPSTDHIAEVLGVGFIQGELHLIQEQLVCETLDTRIEKAYDSGQMQLAEIVSHISGILEGMEVLHSFGFLHPGLSTRKILLTIQGECKLYDFWLEDDAAKVASDKKTKMPFSLNNFAVEVLRCGEYTKDSDVWATGIVIYEILTGDAKPFPEEYEINAVSAIKAPKFTMKYPELRNDTLIRCWSEAASLRPTITYLRSTYKTIFNSTEKTSRDLYDEVDTYLTIDSGDEDECGGYGTVY